MALNIKPYYPLDHPTETLSVREIINKISSPVSTGTSIKSECDERDTFKQNEDIYRNFYFSKGKDLRNNFNEKVQTLLDVI